jgi:CRISPR-associated protein Csy1
MALKNMRVAAFHAAIAQFINERRHKAKKKAGKDAAGDLAAKYDYANWLADAASRVGQIQAVTHVLKATHPNARGSSFYLPPGELPQHAEVGTHTLKENYVYDITGNAGALDVYKFLKIEVGQRHLLDWFLQDDADLLSALHEDEATVKAWANAFKNLFRPASVLASHGKVKQVYWCHSGNPADDAGFHLLQPLFPSTLVHAVHAEITDARFGEANVAARRSRWDKGKKPQEGVTYRDYPDLVALKLGSTKPQTVSQLNSERGGVNYLLASLPPHWREQPRSFFGIDSSLSRFRYYDDVPRLIKKLCQLLKANPKPTMETRRQRERIEQALGRILANFGLEIQARHPSGWTRDPDCKLSRCEQFWLDPDRARLPFRPDHQEDDRAFAREFEWKDWPDDVATLFAKWLNEILRKAGLPVGDTEVLHWARQAIVEVTEWPATVRRRARISGDTSEEPAHD